MRQVAHFSKNTVKMNIQLKFGGVQKFAPQFGCKIDVLTDIGVKFGHLIQCNPTNDVTMESSRKFKN